MACCTPFRQSTNIVGKKWSFTKFSTKASNPSLLQFDKVNHHQLTLMSQIATKFELERNIIVVQNQLARDRTVSLDIKSINSLYIWMICRTNVKHSLVQYFFISIFFLFPFIVIVVYPIKVRIRECNTKLIYSSFPFNLVSKPIQDPLLGHLHLPHAPDLQHWA